MGKAFMRSVCMVCMLCTIHTRCSVHNAVGNLVRSIDPYVDGGHNFSSPSWSEASEPMGSSLNPQLDLKHFQSSQSKEHYKRYGETGDGVEFERRLADPSATKASATSVGSVRQSENVDLERINSIKNENGLENYVKTIPNPIDEGVRSDDLETLRSGVVDSETRRDRVSRDTKAVNTTSEQFHLHQVFAKFGDGDRMTYEGFERLLKTIGLERLVVDELSKARTPVETPLTATNTQPPYNSTSNANNFNTTQINQKSVSRCLKSRDIFSAFVNPSKDEHFHGKNRVDEHDHDHRHDHGDDKEAPKALNKDALYTICPTLLYQLSSATDKEIEEGCFLTRSLLDNPTNETKPATDMSSVWLYSSLSIFGISLCGLLGVAVIPIMQNTFYQQLLQYLVALAIGTLCGDALMHLLPHAMGSNGHSHDPSLLGPGGHDHSQDEHDSTMWKGLVAALGLLFFFITERCLLLGGEWLKQRQRKRKVPARVRVMRDAENNTANATVGEKLCKHKYSSYPYCYGEITTDISDDHHHKNPEYNKTEHNHNTSPPADDKTDPPGNGTYSRHAAVEDDHEPQMSFLGHDGTGKAEKTEAMELNPSEAESYTVIIREHENAHHGHSHTHGHVHSAPSNLTSVACMVIMGDGLHNLTDGMAIGAAFAASIAGGFSTAIAVFCHELPHEIGDFAVLLKAGMSPKQAIFYNVLSSVLCFVGMIIGVHIGQHEAAIQWIFALAGGMFLYIALVDMIPELTSSHSNEGGSFIQFLLQICGMLSGLGIMLIIAANEHKLKTIFST